MDGAEFVAQLKRENERLLVKLEIGARDALLQKTGAGCIPGC